MRRSMTEPEILELTPDGEPVGWQVLDPDGNVVASGPGMFLQAAGVAGEGDETEDGD